MKKIVYITLLLVGIITTSYAADLNPNYDKSGENLGVPTRICTVTSEPCKLSDKKNGDGQMARYECCVSAATGFTDLVSQIYKYIFFISLVLWVLFMVILGIGISMSGFDEGEIKEKAKKQLIATLIGIVALALIPWILKTVAPFIFQ